MRIGTYYYPEQWPSDQWERDFDNIAAMGLQIVHIGEFAWFSLEPSPGEFRFDWLQRCLDMAHKRKLDVILCTPTAAPPVWLSDQFPASLPVDAAGARDRFGGRRHYNPCSLAMQEATQRIVTAMADRFGDHPAVIGWQVDNEYSSKDAGLLAFDQSDETHKAFRRYLQRKYGNSIENLNGAWGNAFWNTYYTDFAQILLPPSRDPRYANPHACLDASRFWSRAFADFSKLQSDILKPRVGKRFITTNFMPFHLDCNPTDFARDLTLFSWDAYPVTGHDADPNHQHFRLGDPAQIGFTHDLMAGYHHRWAQMELQPGQTNWSGVPSLPYPGAIRLWLWTAFAHGAEFVTTYRFRQPLFGIEMFHHGLMTTDGVTPSPGGREFMATIDEVARLDPAKIPSLDKDYASGQPTAGLFFDFEDLWYFKTLPQSKKWDQPKWLMRWYASLARHGFRIKIIRPGHEIPRDCALLVVPSHQLADDETVSRFAAYAMQGGHLLLTCRTALMNKNGQFPEGPIGKAILPLIGASIEAYDVLPDNMEGHVDVDGKKHAWNVWADLLYPEPDTKPLAKYADQFYADAVAITHRKHGPGSVTYCGVHGNQDLTDAVLARLVSKLSLPHAPHSPLPPRAHLHRRGPYHILLNYADTPLDAPAPKTAKFLVGTRHLEPAGVAVWEE